MKEYKIGFAGTDGRTLIAALETSRAKSNLYPGNYHGLIVRGTPAMPDFAKKMDWPVNFVPTAGNSASDYAETLAEAFRHKELDAALVMPETLLFEGIVDTLTELGFGNRVIGLDRHGSFIEADKLACKRLCCKAGIPVAPDWTEVDARNYQAVLDVCLDYLHNFGGAVLKYPFSAGGKGACVILNTWEIREVFDRLMTDYKDQYTKTFKAQDWPLLIEARMSGVEISFTTLVDSRGHYQILPTALDYPERFEGSPGIKNPITGGMGAISPHPMESPALLDMVANKIIEPLIKSMRKKGILRPCILYPGCFVSFNSNFQPTSIRVCEINIRPGEPEFQPVVKRLRNLGALLEATINGTLDRVKPEVREDQISMCIALVTGPGGPKQQKGYPWSLTKGELVEMDFDYFNKKKIVVIPSAMDFTGGIFKSDGSRVAYLAANATVKAGNTVGQTAEILRQKLYGAIDAGKIRVIPREDKEGNRLAYRNDIGTQYSIADTLRPKT